MEKRDKISIIVPCYNEEKTILPFYQEVETVLNSMQQVDYEIIFINDGSIDETQNILRSLAEKDEHCHYLSFSRNFGKEAGMYAGLQEASGDYCVIMDVDLQHPPALLPEMYHAVSEEGYDCCGGKRCGRTGDGIIRSFCSKMFYKIVKQLTNMDMSDGYGDFRMMNKNVVNAILEMREYNRYMKGIYSFIGFQTKWIEFENIERTEGSSKWHLRSLLSYAEEGILAFSGIPLKLAGMMGIILILAAVICVFIRTEIILPVLLLLSGMQMLFLYIVGLYVFKDTLENKKRPLYIIKEKDNRNC